MAAFPGHGGSAPRGILLGQHGFLPQGWDMSSLHSSLRSLSSPSAIENLTEATQSDGENREICCFEEARERSRTN